jgi:hypothetical protein
MSTTMHRILVAVGLTTALGATPSPADEVVRLPTRPGVEQSFLLLEPAGAPKGVVVQFPGHEGVVRFSKAGDSYEVENEGGGLTAHPRMRERLRAAGFAVALLAPPSDRAGGMGTVFRSSPEHAEDVRRVIAFLHGRYKSKPYLQGHCRSTFSPAAVATRLKNDGISGVILSSTRSTGDHGSVMDYQKGAIGVPVLLVHHTDDPCPGTPYYNVERLKKFYETAAPKVDVIRVSGGDTQVGRQGKCGGGAHAFKGLQGEVAQAIVGWLEHREFPSEIRGPPP